MIRTLALTATAIGIVLAGAVWRAAAVPADNNAAAQNTHPLDQQFVWQTWKLYCDSCHLGPRARAGVNLETLDLANLDHNGATWEKVLRTLRTGVMPPPGALRPDDTTFKTLVKAIDNERDRVTDVKPTPGRPTLHRLNRAEYGNAIRDLLALEVDVSELLPPDDSGYGFDNIGDVLTVSPELMERYLLAAGKIARQAVGDTRMRPTYVTYTIPHGLKQNYRMSDDLPVGSRGGMSIKHFFPVDGEYDVLVELQKGNAQEVLGTGRERMLDLKLDDQRVQLFTIPPSRERLGAADVTGVTAEAEQGYKIRLPIKAGTHTIAAAFQKDTVLPEGIIFRPRFDDISSHFEGVGAFSVGGPYNVQGPGDTASREKIFVCHPAAIAEEQACAEKILANIAHHAYRRPVTAEDMPQLLALYKLRCRGRRLRARHQIGLAEDPGVARLHFSRRARSG